MLSVDDDAWIVVLLSSYELQAASGNLGGEDNAVAIHGPACSFLVKYSCCVVSAAPSRNSRRGRGFEGPKG